MCIFSCLYFPIVLSKVVSLILKSFCECSRSRPSTRSWFDYRKRILKKLGCVSSSTFSLLLCFLLVFLPPRQLFDPTFFYYYLLAPATYWKSSVTCPGPKTPTNLGKRVHFRRVGARYVTRRRRKKLNWKQLKWPRRFLLGLAVLRFLEAT